MTRRRLTALAAALLTALPFLCAGDVRAEAPPAANLHSAALDLGGGWAQTVWLDDQERPYDLGLVFRLPTPRPVPGIAIPVVYEGDVPTMIRAAARRHGVDAERLVQVAKCESGFDPRAKNPRSTASGVFQFIDTTWAGTPEAKAGRSVFDAAANVEAGARLARGGWGPWASSRGCWA
jgi:soluble lytic murein transglycosylase-like protein